MPTARMKDGHVAVPDEIKRALDLHDGDRLEAHVVAGGMFLWRASGSSEEVERAWETLFSIIRRPKGEPAADPRRQEEEIAEEIKATRNQS